MHSSVSRLAVFCSLLALAFALAACDGSSPTDPGDSARRLPLNLRMSGNAFSLEEGDITVSCLIDIGLQLEPGPRGIPGGLEYRGTHGGAMGRGVLPAEGTGFSSLMDVHGDVIVRSLTPDRVEIIIPGAEGSGYRFWDELAKLEGVLGPDGIATGTWNCAPFDIGPEAGAYEDRLYTAPGTWTLGPSPW